MKLYKITSTHLAPKDSHRAIQEYLVAENDKAVFSYLSRGHGKEYTYWNDKVDIDYWIDCGYESTEEQMNEWISQTMDNCSEDWNDDLYTDLYYGRTIYGWEETGVTDEECMKLMVKNGLAILYESKGDE